jgi:hypothetical protein
MHFLKVAGAAGLLSFALLATSCQPGTDKAADITAAAAPAASAVTHAELVADHQKMEADHRIMQTADSVMEADHQQALTAAQRAGIDKTAPFQALEKRHGALITEHQQVITRHDTVLNAMPSWKPTTLPARYRMPKWRRTTPK